MRSRPLRSRLFNPFWLPVWFFLTTIAGGAVLLSLAASRTATSPSLSWSDALFTATSAMCVTGLAVVDTGSYFSLFGQGVVLFLIQLGGLGIMTYTSLAVYLMGRRVTLKDRIAVGQSLLHDPSFKLSRFLLRVVVGVLVLESLGALVLWGMDPVGFTPWSALFHSISAFCNAGFSLFADSLSQWRTHWGVNVVFMVLFVLGGLGFAVLDECAGVGRAFLLRRESFWHIRGPWVFSWHTRVVLSMTAVLTLGGTAAIFWAEWLGGASVPWHETLLTSLFQSVTCRTAGFNTVEIVNMTNVSLMIMMVLMFIGGSPGSTAGGIKTTTARALVAYVVAQFRGREQARAGDYALSKSTRSKAITLFVFAALLIWVATMVLGISEGGDTPHNQARGQFLETLFEVVSAFGTVGLTMGVTGKLTLFGKLVVSVLMFIGRLGPIWLLAALRSWQAEPRYRIPESDLPLG